MKSLVIFSLCLALAFGAVPPQETKLHPNKEYVYDYETEALTGVPAASHHLAGVKVRCTVHLQVKGTGKLLAQLRNIELCAISEDVEHLHLMRPVGSGEICTPITDEAIKQPMVEALSLSVKFGLTPGGLLSYMQVDKADPYWSVNIKRGLLSIFNVNLQEIEARPTLPEHLVQAMRSAAPAAGHQTLGPFFKTMEQDLIGKCETVYALVNIPGQVPILNVTKVRNLDACVERPIYQHGLMATLDCRTCSPKLPLRSEAFVNYKVRGNRQNFLIESAVQHAHIITKPFNAADGQLVTMSFQKLILKDVLTQPSSIPISKTRIQKDPFTFELPSKLSELQRISEPNSPHTAGRVPLIKEFIEKLLTFLEPAEINVQAPELLADLVIQLRKIPLPELEALVTELCPATTTDNISYKKRELILDVLPTIGRPDIIPVLKKLIITDKVVGPIRASIIVNMMALTTEPAPLLITELLEVYKEVVPTLGTGYVQLQRTILLTAGALAHTLNKIYTTTYVPKEITIPARHKIVQAFKPLLEITDVETRIIVLKAVGNAGLVELVPLLKNIIMDESQPAKVRALAIYAIRRVTLEAKHEVHATLLPLVIDPTVPLKVRMAALGIALHTQPESAIVTLVAQHLRHETNIQFASFAWSYLKALAMSEIPCNRNISEAARVAIKEVPVMYPGLPYSKVINTELLISHLHHLGAEIALDLVTPGVSILPETVVTRVNAYFAKSIFNVLEVGVESKGIQTVLRNLVGPEGLLMEVLEGRKSLSEIISPILNPSMINMESIQRLLASISERDLSSLSADIYMKLFNTELRYFSLSTPTIKEYIRLAEGRISEVLRQLTAGVPVNIIKALPLVDQSVMLPTPSGMPVSINVSSISIMEITGELKLEGITSLSQIITGTPSLTVKANLVPKIISEFSAKMGVDLAFVKAGMGARVRANINTPMALETLIDMPTGKVQATIQAPTTTRSLVKIDVTPLAMVIKEVPNPIVEKILFKKIVTPIYNPTKVLPMKVNMPLGAEVLGLKFLVKGEYGMIISPTTPARFFCMPHVLEIIVAPGTNAPKFIEVIVGYLNPTAPEYSSIRESILRGQSQPISNSWFSASSAGPAFNFDPVTPNPVITSPIQRQILLLAQTKEDNVPRKAAIQLTVLTEPTFLNYQADIQIGVQAPSIPEPRIIKLDTLIKIPSILVHPGPAPTTKTELAVIKYAYGPQGNTAEYVTIKSFFHIVPVPEIEYMKQTVIESIQSAYETVDSNYRPPPETTTYSRADRYVVHSMPAVSALPAFTPAKPFHLAFEISYKPSPVIAENLPLLSRMWVRLLDMPTYIYPTASVSIYQTANTPQIIEAKIIALPSTSMAEIVLKTPLETVFIQGIPLPFAALWHPYHSFPVLPEAVRRIASHPVFTGVCSLQEGKVMTFDEVGYTMPETECETILTQDCSSKKLFRVTYMKSPQVPTKKIVKLYIGSNIVEIAPSTSWSSSHVEIKINNVPVTLIEGTPVEIKDRSQAVIGVAIKKGHLVEIKEAKLQLAIETDCHKVWLKVPAWFRGELCGMCGNFDSEKVNDVSGPNKELYSNPEHAVAHYVLSSARCNPEELKRRFLSNIIPSSLCSPQARTVYLERTLEGVPHACFSIEPVMMCASTCKPTAPVSRRMPFHCQALDLPSTRQLKDLLALGPITSIADKTPVIHEPVVTYGDCVRF